MGWCSVEKIGFVSCVKGKAPSPRPAEILYTSDLFQKARTYVNRCYNRWFILSAKLHLVEPSTVIEPYDETLLQKNAGQRRQWAKTVYEQIRQQLPEPRGCILYFHAGEYYRKYLMSQLQQDGYRCEVPLRGLGIGQQLGWYKLHNSQGSCQY